MTYRFFLRHAAVLVLALLAGTLTLAPQLIVQHRLGAAYQGIHEEMNPDEGYYMTRAQEVIDGHPTLANPYLYEQKSEPSLQVWVPEAALAWVSVAIFRDVHTGAMAWDFLFPAVIMLLTYAIFLLLTKSRLQGVGGATLLSIGLYLGQLNRPISPQFNFIFQLIFFLLLFQVVLSNGPSRKRNFATFAAITLGAMFYIYTYYWTYIVILLGLAAAGSFVFFRKERLHMRLAAILGGGLVLGIPYFWGMRAAASLPYYRESLARVGMIATHSPSGIFIVAAGTATLLVMLVLWRIRVLPFTPLSVVLASGVLAGIIAVNQAVVTGLNLEFSSHYHLVSMYADFFALALCAKAVLDHAGAPRRVWLERGALVLIFLFSLWSVGRLAWSQTFPTPEFIAQQRYAPVLTWLNAHTNVDDVVYADDMLSYLIPAYTHDNVFYSGGIVLYIMPQSDVRARFLREHYFDTTLTAASFLDLGIERQLYGNTYLDYSAHMLSLNTLRRVFGLAPLPIARYPEADIAAVIQEEKQLRTGSFVQALSGYRVDYIVWDRQADPGWKLDAIPQLHKVSDVGVFSVYTLSVKSAE